MLLFRRLLFPLLFVIVPVACSAQTFGAYFRELDFGVGMEQIAITAADSSESFLGAGFLMGWNFPIARPADDMAIGINPALDFLFVFLSEDEASAVLQAPVFLTLKYGADARYYNQSKQGATLGLGYRFGTFTGSGLGYSGLSALAEVATTAGRVLLKLRYTTTLGTITVDSETTMVHRGLYLVLTGSL
jgi:hypothetical protein